MFFLGDILEFEFRASHLLSRYSYQLSHTPSPFALVTFQVRFQISCPRLAWDQTTVLLPTASHIAGVVGACLQLVCWDEDLLTFCLDWPWTVILPVSASLVARITGVSHHIQLVVHWCSYFWLGFLKKLKVFLTLYKCIQCFFFLICSLIKYHFNVEKTTQVNSIRSISFKIQKFIKHTHRFLFKKNFFLRCCLAVLPRLAYFCFCLGQY
jgi:hypothetical protein